MILNFADDCHANYLQPKLLTMQLVVLFCISEHVHCTAWSGN